MLILGIFLFIPTGSFAAQNGNYENDRFSTTSKPMDYNDNKGINPNSNFIFNFEQIRRDQPPHVEMREENIGRYMYQPRTTTEPIVVVPEVKIPEQNENRAEALSELKLPLRNENSDDNLSQQKNVLPPRKNYYYPQWDPTSMQTSTLLPASLPPAPKLNDFTEHFSNPAIPNLNSHNTNPFQNMPVNVEHHVSQVQQNYFVSQPDQEQVLHDFVKNFVRPALPSVMPSHVSLTTPISVSPEAYQRFGQDFAKEARGDQPTVNRGTRKFSRNDLITSVPEVNPTFQQPTSTVKNLNRGPPAPVPTLSPWIDGLGK